MCYTSGTTGNPKGVVYSHRSTYLHSLGGCSPTPSAVSERDVVLPVVPMFHANAWGLRLRRGDGRRRARVARPADDAGGDRRLIEEERVTLAAGVPTIWMGAARSSRAATLSSLRAILCGGSAVPKALSEAYREKLGQPILHAWGMTETARSARSCRSRARCRPRARTSWPTCAPPRASSSPLMECRIVEPGHDDELPWDGEARGELQVAGPWIAPATTTTSAAPDSFTEDGWLRTGDVATIDAEGYIRLVDRTKDLVKSGGEWISSVELENEIMAHPRCARRP